MWLRPSHLQQSLVEAVDVEFICICHHLLTVEPPAGVGSHLGIYISFPKNRSTEVAVVVVEAMTEATVGPLLWPHSLHPLFPHWNPEAELCFLMHKIICTE